MSNSIRAIVREGKIELLEKVEIPEGTEVLITPLIGERDSRQSAAGSEGERARKIEAATESVFERRKGAYEELAKGAE
jgi:hypothetical protein